MKSISSSNYEKIISVTTEYFKSPTKSLKNILLYGIAGSGKTFAVKQLCKDMNYKLRYISQETIASSYGGQSEIHLKNLFYGKRIPTVDERIKIKNPASKECQNTIVLIDEVDSIDGYALNLLINLIDEQPFNIFVIGTTNLLKSLDLQLTRYGRFDVEIHMEPLTRTERIVFLRYRNINEAIIEKLLPFTNGCVFADMVELCRLINKFRNTDTVLLQFKPAILRNSIEFLVELNESPKIVGYSDIKDKINKYVLEPYRNPEKYIKFKMSPIKGLLMYGPPGCSKTKFASYIAYHLQARFFVASCAQIVSPYTGEAERKLRSLFNRARLAGPSVIFFDEIEALVGKRGSGETFKEKIITTFLTELDGIEQCKDVLLIGATNRPDQIDSALLRPGRMEKLLYIGKPDPQTRIAILSHYMQLYKIEISVEMISDISDRCVDFSGAQIQGLVKTFVVDVVISQNKDKFDLEDFLPFIKLQQRTKSVEMNEINIKFNQMSIY